MSSTESSNLQEIQIEPVVPSNSQTLEKHVELEQGRVWRRGCTGIQLDKKNVGPNLRTTVKPVKRFRPESNPERSNPSPNRKKKLRTQSTFPRSNSESDFLNAEGNLVERDSEMLSSPERRGISICEKLKTLNNQHSEESVAPVKKKRVWEQWTVEDKNYFFEAVAMYGKDFEAIRTAIAQKHRKRGQDCIPKTKDQVRHLYYRTWTMISKIIDPDAYPPAINKAFQELYAVINYGEIRKKVGGNLKKKGIEKLNELIRDGFTTTKIRSKNIRIKTPSCKALKKMNPEYQEKEGYRDLPLVSDTRRMKIPLFTILELCPLTMASWNQVHSIAHNPRLRIKLSMECKLSTLFTYLENKWKPVSERWFDVAHHCQSGSKSADISELHIDVPRIWDKTLAIQTPPEASVNTRIMVFQVSNNRTHCVVSYALRKLVPLSQRIPLKPSNIDEEIDKSKQEELDENNEDLMITDNSDVLNGPLSESEFVDSSLSSEEDYDYDSAHENTKDYGFEDNGSNCSSPTCPNSPKFDSSGSCVQSLDVVFAMKEGGAAFSPPNFAEPIAEKPTSCYFDDALACPLENDNNNMKPQGRFDSEEIANTEGAKSLLDNNNASKKESDSLRSSKEMDVQYGNVLLHTARKSVSFSEKLSAMDADGVGVLESDEPTMEDHEDDGKISWDDTVFSGDTVNDITEEVSNDENNAKIVLSTRLFNKSGLEKRLEARTRKVAKKSRICEKAAQIWTSKSCQRTTIAEIYMMLGRPSVFKLCYDWIHASSKVPKEKQDLTLKSGEITLSTGLTALIQAAKLARIHNIDAKKKSDPGNVVQKLCTRPNESNMKHVALQCSILKPDQKEDKLSDKLPSTASIGSHTYGRGIGKIIPVKTLVVDNNSGTGFAIPAVPIAKQPRKIAANPNQPMQEANVSQATLNWLFRARRSNKTVSKKIRSLDKALQRRKCTNFKQMKTFSFIQRGSNKIGFRPSDPVMAPVPATPTSQNIRKKVSTNAQANELNKKKSCVRPQSGKIIANSTNLLVQAAEEAGVAPLSVMISNASLPASNSESPVLADLSPASCETATMNMPAAVNTTLPGPALVQPQLSNGLLIASKSVAEVPAVTSSFATQTIAMTATIPTVTFTTVTSTTPALANSIESLLDMSWSGHELGSTSSIETMMNKLAGNEKDVVLTSLNDKDKKSSEPGRSLVDPLPLRAFDENSNGPSLSRDNFDLSMTPVKTSNPPIHPWTISTNSRDGLGLSNLLNTPQKILPSDTEDSLDGLMLKSNMLENTKKFSLSTSDRRSPPVEEKKSSRDKGIHLLQDQSSSSNFLCASDPEVDIQLRCMLNENSIDYITSFQDLVSQTTECEEMSVIANDENARDGHIQSHSNH